MIQSENTIGGMTMNILTLLVQVYCSIMVLQLQYSQKRHRSSYIWQPVTIIYLWNVGSDAELALNQSKPVNKWPDLFSIVRCGESSCTFKNVTIVLQTWIQQDVIGHLKKKKITIDKLNPTRIFLLFLLQWWTWLPRWQLQTGRQESHGRSHTALPAI